MNKVHIIVEVEHSASHIEKFNRYISEFSDTPCTDAINEVVDILEKRGLEDTHSFHAFKADESTQETNIKNKPTKIERDSHIEAGTLESAAILLACAILAPLGLILALVLQ